MLQPPFDGGKRFRPGALAPSLGDPRAALEAYVQLYVREEIRLEALVRNLPAFLCFLPVAALFHGQVINIAGLARDAEARGRRSRDTLAFSQDTLVANCLG